MGGRLRYSIVGLFAIVLVAGSIVIVNAKQVVCRPLSLGDSAPSGWWVKILRDLYCPAPPDQPPVISFNYAVATGLSAADADNYAAGLRSSNSVSAVSQLANSDPRFKANICSYRSDSSSGVVLKFQGTPPGSPTSLIAINSRNGLPPPPHPTPCQNLNLPAQLSTLQTGRGLALNQAIFAGLAEFAFNSQGNMITATTANNGYFQLELHRYDSNAEASFEVMLRDNTGPNNNTVILIYSGYVLAAVQ